MDANLKTVIVSQFKNTQLGFLRIKKNLNIVHFTDDETVNYLRTILSSTPLEHIDTKGKNYYFKCFEYNAVITVNSSSFTVITAKQIKNSQTFNAT